MKAIETGTTRCPRCMASSPYTFFDCADGSITYEVRCDSCQHIHTEVSITTSAVSQAA